jgi:hypothetical protein
MRSFIEIEGKTFFISFLSAIIETEILRVNNNKEFRLTKVQRIYLKTI